MSVRRHFSRLHQGGDTIVEVLIVLAVLGLALSISYSTASKSLLATRAAQENSQATQLVQAQVEKLYALSNNAETPDNKYIFKPRPTAEFCIDNTNVIVEDTTQAACNPGSPVSYKLGILYCKLSSNPICNTHATDDTFIFTASWDNVQGFGKDSVTLTYRIHPASTSTAPGGGGGGGGGGTECDDGIDNDNDLLMDFGGGTLTDLSGAPYAVGSDPQCNGDPNDTSESF